MANVGLEISTCLELDNVFVSIIRHTACMCFTIVKFQLKLCAEAVSAEETRVDSNERQLIFRLTRVMILDSHMHHVI